MHLIKRLFIGICDARALASPGDDPEFSAARKWGLSIRRETGTLRFSLPGPGAGRERCRDEGWRCASATGCRPPCCAC